MFDDNDKEELTTTEPEEQFDFEPYNDFSAGHVGIITAEMLTDTIDMHSFASLSFTYDGAGGRDDFWVVDFQYFQDYMAEEFPEGEEILRDNGAYNLFERLCELQFEDGMWGIADDYITCVNCNSAIYVGDYSRDAYFSSDDGYVCEHCVKSDPGDYLQHLTNNVYSYNDILRETDLEDLGYEIYWSCSKFDSHDSSVLQGNLSDFLAENPGGEAIFDETDHWDFRMWVKTDTLAKRADEADDEYYADGDEPGEDGGE